MDKKTEASQNIQDYILYTVKSLTDDKENITVEVEGENTKNYKIHAPATERGKIIGKQGKIIYAIRLISQHMAAPHGFKVQVNVIE
jgi:predicted RNA-binding protein YlqC (UPF0109 family)